ncbi:MAG: RagB/SusD family nutrient uptake outer membrane protein [Prevotella sp.]|nr:RagB/SusD family nutrient uptake outer membrane protein [Prevotella sp.]
MIFKINKLLYSCLVGCATSATILPLASCSDFLEIKSRSEIVLEDFWNEKADVDNIVAGCYSRMQSDDVMRRLIIWGEARSENVMAGNNIDRDGNLENVLKENITIKNPYTTWDGLYNVINRCNTVLKYAPGVAQTDPGYTQSELRATVAEVSALRDLCYFYLIRTFRDVPYITEAVTDDDQPMQVEPSDFYTVLDALIADLESVQGDAIKRYPETNQEYQTGRITKCAIWAMLCEMYLWKGDYDNCIKYADMVIADKQDLALERRSEGSGGYGQSANSSRTNGYPLVSNGQLGVYGSAFTDIFVTGNSQETIFELVFDNNNAGNSMLGNSACGLFYGNSTVVTGYIAPATSIIEEGSNSEQRVVYATRNKLVDARIYENIDAEGGISKFVRRNVSIMSTGSTPSATYGSKYVYAKVNNVDHYYNSSNWIVYRLSDIMLLKAEALCQQMQDGADEDVVAHNAPLLEQAFSLVNAVNKRSVCQQPLVDTLRASDYNTRTLMENLVMTERQRELMFEGKRWYDLVRRSMRDGNTDVLCQAVARREGINGQYVLNFFSSPNTGMRAIFWPYNEEETKVSPPLAAHQNPAFGSGESSISK